MAAIDIDVAIIGAGLSGIDAGYHIQTSTNLTYQIYDERSDIGGTWSVFKFPGIRSDVEIFSYSFPFRPYTGRKPLRKAGKYNSISKRWRRNLELINT